MKFVLKDQLADDLLHELLLQAKEAGEVLKAERSVLLSGSQDEALHSCSLECFVESLLQESIFELGHASDRIDAVDVLESTLPVRFIQGSGSKDNMILGLLSIEDEGLLVIVKLDQTAPLTRDDMAGH